MSDINVNNDYTKMNNLSPFKLCVIQNFPFIEADFDAVTNYQLLCKVVEYLNNIIDNNNKQNTNITQLEQNFITLYNYVKDYFDNLDVQEEINNKLDKMILNGTFPSLLKNVLPFVMPEWFGAVGDGVTDDTNAFIQCFNSGLPIELIKGKTYLVDSDINLPDCVVVMLNGNGATVKNMCLTLNIENDTWKHQYPIPKSYIMNVTFENVGKEFLFYSGTPLKIENVYTNNYDVVLKTPSVYMDYINIKNVFIRNHHADTYAFQINGIGDQLVFNTVHVSDPSDSKVLKTMRRNAFYCNNALNGHYFIENSVALFETCHFERGSITTDIYSNCTLNSCWLRQSIHLSSNVKLDGCSILMNAFISSIGESIDLENMDTRNCKILLAPKNTIDHESYVDIDKFNTKNIVMTNDKKECVYYNVVKESEYECWKESTGRCEYTFYPSVTPLNINCGNYQYSKKVLTINISSIKQYSVFIVSSEFANGFIHCYRKIGNSIKKAIVPMSEALYMFDYGTTINGIKWKVCEEIPNLSTSNICHLVNGVLVLKSGVLNSGNGDCLTYERDTLKMI